MNPPPSRFGPHSTLSLLVNGTCESRIRGYFATAARVTKRPCQLPLLPPSSKVRSFDRKSWTHCSPTSARNRYSLHPDRPTLRTEPQKRIYEVKSKPQIPALASLSELEGCVLRSPPVVLLDQPRSVEHYEGMVPQGDFLVDGSKVLLIPISSVRREGPGGSEALRMKKEGKEG